MRTKEDPCAGFHTPLAATETDWLAIFLALAAVVYSGAHYIGHDFEYINHYLYLARSPSIRTACAIFQRLAIDFIRFILAVLGIILVLVLEFKNAIASLSHRFWNGSVVNSLGEYTWVIEKISMHYDAANHGRRAYATRQGLRAARAQIGTLLRWGLPVAVLLVIIHGPPDYTDSPPTSRPEVRPYVIPGWVIRARPENRHKDRSNSHYIPSDECLAFDKMYNSEGALAISKSGETKSRRTGTHTLEAEIGNQSTVTIAHTHTETGTGTTTIEHSATETLALEWCRKRFSNHQIGH
jgi:hypothetical protein